jgi:hypothetical protein
MSVIGIGLPTIWFHKERIVKQPWQEAPGASARATALIIKGIYCDLHVQQSATYTM